MTHKYPLCRACFCEFFRGVRWDPGYIPANPLILGPSKRWLALGFLVATNSISESGSSTSESNDRTNLANAEIFGSLTLPETNSKSTRKWMVGILLSFSEAYFQGRTVSFREGSPLCGRFLKFWRMFFKFVMKPPSQTRFFGCVMVCHILELFVGKKNTVVWGPICRAWWRILPIKRQCQREECPVFFDWPYYVSSVPWENQTFCLHYLVGIKQCKWFGHFEGFPVK